MASNYVLERARQTERVRELVFAGDGVRLSGQINYPVAPPPLSSSGYPLIFVLHHAGWNTRSDYDHYARMALASGYAVFRWDKRGTGRSGAGGRGSTTQDAVMAYETALAQPNVDHNQAVVLAQGEGTLMLGNSFGLFARIQLPMGVILAGNMLDKSAVLAINTTLLIVNGEKDWNDWRKFAHDASDAHNHAYAHKASYYVARDASRSLMVEKDEQKTVHAGAMHAIQEWLTQLGAMTGPAASV